MLPYSKQNITIQDIEAVTTALSAELITSGPLVEEFESTICKETGSKFAIVCSSGTAALHLACLALDIPKEAVGLTSPITFVASANCLRYVGARVDLIDIDPQSRCLSPDALEEYCKTSPPPAVVVVVDFAGIVADLPRIYQLGQQYGFQVIEDASHSLGSQYRFNGTWFHAASCAHADLATLSFHPVKSITTGEGGAVTTNCPVLAKRLRKLRSHGIEREASALPTNSPPWYYEMQELGFNYRISDFQCALGISQLRRLREIREKKQHIVTRYLAELGKTPGLYLPTISEDQNPCFHLFSVCFAEGADRRSQMYSFLRQHSIGTQVHYIPVYRHPYYNQDGRASPARWPEAEHYYQSCLSLPLFPELDETERADVVVRVMEGLTQPLQSR